MSWRLLLRLVGLLVAGRAAARAARSRSPGPAGVPMSTARQELRRRLADLRRDAGIAARAVYLIGFLAAAGALATAGTSSALLAPRWLGAVLLVLAGSAVVGAVLEARGLHRAVLQRRLQRRDRNVRRDL